MVRARWSRLLAATASLALLSLASPAGAAGPLNVVRGVVAAESGGATVVTILGSETATFTSYKLERPQRLAIEVARCRLQGVDSPVDVSSWAVGQVAISEGTGAQRVCRVLIHLRRDASYGVRAVGGNVVVKIVPHDAKP